MARMFCNGNCGRAVEIERPFGALEGYTKYKRGHLRFLAHPNDHSEGPWFDWVIVKM
jgi:hypothetical protein